MPAHMALQVVLQAPANQLECLILAILAHVVNDEPLHRQRFAMVWVFLEHLHGTV